MAKKPNIFQQGMMERHEEQEALNNELVLKKKKPTRKEKLNITLSKDAKDKLMRYSELRHISASVLIQMWIDEHCN